MQGRQDARRTGREGFATNVDSVSNVVRRTPLGKFHV